MVKLVARRPLAARRHVSGTIVLTEGKSGAEGNCGTAHIDVTGAGSLDLLAITGLERGATGVLTTRLAALRVTIAWHRSPEMAQIEVERFSADYLWAWLTNRMMM